MVQKGTKELKELLDLVLTGVDIAVSVGADGKVDLADMGQVMKLIPVVAPAFDNIDQVPAEFTDLTEEEAVELVTYTMAKLAISDAHAVKVINAGFKVLIASYALYQILTEKPAVAPAPASVL